MNARLMISSLLLVVVFMGACTAETATQDASAISTAAAKTVVADITKVAPPTAVPPTPTQTPTLTPAASPTNLPQEEIPAALFVDDFDTETGWVTEKNDRYGYEWIEGGYFIYVNVPSAQVHSVRSLDVDNVRLQTEGAQIAGPADGYYGVVCRFQDANNYYAFLVSNNGFYSIAKMENATFSTIQEGQDETGDVLVQGAPNVVRGDCINQTLTLFVNDQKLLEIQDVLFDEGVIGLIAGTELEGGVRVLYNYFAILQP